MTTETTDVRDAVLRLSDAREDLETRRLEVEHFEAREDSLAKIAEEAELVRQNAYRDVATAHREWSDGDTAVVEAEQELEDAQAELEDAQRGREKNYVYEYAVRPTAYSADGARTPVEYSITSPDGGALTRDELAEHADEYTEGAPTEGIFDVPIGSTIIAYRRDDDDMLLAVVVEYADFT